MGEFMECFGPLIIAIIMIVLLCFVLGAFWSYKELTVWNKTHNSDIGFGDWFWGSTVIKDYQGIGEIKTINLKQ